MTSAEKGRRGEAAAETFLVSSGMTVLRRNYRSRRGEVDLVAKDGDTVVFAEVKHWTRYSEDDIGLSVDRRKAGRIIGTAKAFLAEHREFADAKIRFDLVFVRGMREDILHLKDVLREES